MTRPICERPGCGGEVPESMWSEKDEAAERDYNRRTNTPHRPLYDTPRCFRIVRDHACGQVHDRYHRELECGETHERKGSTP